MIGIPKKRRKLLGALEHPYGLLSIAAFIALALLLTLRETSAAGAPLLPAVLVLFILPGAVLASLLDAEGYGALARAPLAFVLSAGVFGLLALPPLVLKWTLSTYLIACGVVVAVSLAGAIFLEFRSPAQGSSPSLEREARWLWLPLGALTTVLAAISTRIFYPPNTDTWAYLMYVQKFLELERLNSFTSGFTRSTLSGWLLEQAAISRVSGMEPVNLTLDYLAPALVVVALLAFYSLALALFEGRPAALFSSCLAALFFVVYLSSSKRSPGYELVGRIVEDKFFVRFVFLPVGLALAMLFLRERRLRYLGLFAFVYVSVVSIHPLGLVLIGISITGFGVVHLFLNLRSPGSWKSFGALAGVMLGIVLPPLAYLVATGSSLLSGSSSTDPEKVELLVSSWQKQELLLKLGEGSYIMHPSFLLNPVILGAYVLGVPFLLWRVKRSLAAQLLLGIMSFTAALVFLPPVASFIGQIIGPWTLWRVAWPISLASLLVVGWVSFEVLKYAGSRLRHLRRGPAISRLLPLAFICLLAIILSPRMADSARSAAGQGQSPQDATVCTDPVFPWMSGSVEKPATVLTPALENICFPAYVAADFVGYRVQTPSDSEEAADVPQNAADIHRFFDTAAFDDEMVTILRRYSIDYVLVPTASPLNAQLQRLPGFGNMDEPGQRYEMYAVDLAELEKPLIEANGFLNRGELQAALEAYKGLFENGTDQRFLAHLGLGRAYMRLDLPQEAADHYEQATRISPESVSAYSLLAEAYTAAGDQSSARAALEKAISIAPRRVSPRFELGDLLLEMGNEQRALEQYRSVVDMYPQVPDYHIRMGEALNRAGDLEAADEQFKQAVGFDPRSASLYAEVGLANQRTKRFEQAATYYEEALDIEPSAPRIHRLGITYLQLAIRDNESEEYFPLAEMHLQSVGELEPEANGELRKKAQFALGKLYESWGKKRKASAAYERVLEIDPDFEPARQKLEEPPG